MSIFTILFVVLLVAWLLGLTVFHVAGGLIHLLLIFAVISLIVHVGHPRGARRGHQLIGQYVAGGFNPRAPRGARR